MNRQAERKNISIVGSTGSIGIQALDVVRRFPERFNVVGLAASSDWKTLVQQAHEFHPLEIALMDESAYENLREHLAGEKITLWSKEEGVSRIASMEQAHTTLISVVGVAGLLPTLAALDTHKTIALATKEVLVVAGDLVMKRARQNRIDIIPVDSEHSAIFQCIGSSDSSSVSRILLTSSGGPFRGYGSEELSEVTLEAALAHPTWSMGKKITIDSATLMNKGFEVIEAHHLFSVPLERIEVIVHPQSIIHSLVEFVDGSTMAQLSPPDMRLPIQFALAYPERLRRMWKTLRLEEIGALTFEKPDMSVFRCLGLAYEAAAAGMTMPCVLNAANEVAVASCLKGRIHFRDIPAVVSGVMHSHEILNNPSLSDIIEVDRWARAGALDLIEKIR